MKADIETLFLESLQEVKRDLSKSGSLRLASTSTSKGVMNTKEALM